MEDIDLEDLQPSGGLTGAGSENKPKSTPLRSVAGWIITGALIYAPFAFGSVPQFAIQQLNFALTAAACCWILDCLFSRRAPRVPFLVVVCGVVALSLGWFMTWNARSTFELHGVYLLRANITPHKPALPGALEMIISRLTMQRLDTLFGALLTVTDMAVSRVWRNRWVTVIACTGAAIAAFGIAQQSGMVTFVASRMSQIEGQYYATYNYHGNAGAYMNLALPLSFVLCLHAAELRKPAAQRYGAAALFAITLAGILANTSRGAQAISIGLLIGIGTVGVLKFISPSHRIFRYRHVVWPLISVAIAAALGAVALHSSANAKKWRELPTELAKNSSRWQVWRVTVPMARSAGRLGHGPGSFKLLLPASPLLTEALLSRWVLQPQIIPGMTISMWSMAHNDYLQTWVEFGSLGLAMACTILFGGVIRALKRIRSKFLDVQSPDGFVLFGATTAVLGVIVHSTFDFPLQVASIQITVVVLLGICWSSRRWDEGNKSI